MIRLHDHLLGSRRTSGTSVKTEATPIKLEPGSAEAEGGAAGATGAAADASASPPATAEAPAPVVVKQERVKSEKELMREQAQNRRTEMLREQGGLIKRFTQLVLPTLVEVYAASVALHVRVKALLGILKIISFVDAEPLSSVLDNVPLAGFIGAILSSRDDPSLVLPALQMVELLCNKLPQVYQSLLRREGVMWEIEDIASKQPSTTKYGSSGAPKVSLPSGSSEGATTAGATPAAPAAATSGEASASSPASGRLYGASSSAVAGSSLAGRSVGATTTTTTSVGSPTPQEAQDALIWRSRILRDRFAREAAFRG